MSARIEMVGLRFGRLMVTRNAKTITRPSGYTIRTVWVRCDCGTKKVVRSYLLRTGNVASCGCLRSDMVTQKNTTHGEAPRSGPTPEYQAWSDMVKRCTNPHVRDFQNWGGRGIKVCDRWANSFDNFIADVGRRPTKHHTLDRYPNNDGNYEPTNVRWATRKQQANNQRPRRRHVA